MTLVGYYAGEELDHHQERLRMNPHYQKDMQGSRGYKFYTVTNNIYSVIEWTKDHCEYVTIYDDSTPKRKDFYLVVLILKSRIATYNFRNICPFVYKESLRFIARYDAYLSGCDVYCNYLYKYPEDMKAKKVELAVRKKKVQQSDTGLQTKMTDYFNLLEKSEES